MSSTSTVKLYKKLPTLDPDQFNAWTTAVESAFTYHKWSEYLLPPAMSSLPVSSTPDTTAPLAQTQVLTGQPHPVTGRDVEIEIITRAYLIEAIPFQMYSKFHGSTYTFEIWNALKGEYQHKSREDRLRIEGQLNTHPENQRRNLDQFIERFEKLSAKYKDQVPGCKSDQINGYFLQSLERSRIQNEKWIGFVTYL
jgi:hypothetical protein